MVMREYALNVDINLENSVPSIQAIEGEKNAVCLYVFVTDFADPVDLTDYLLGFEASNTQVTITTNEGFNLSNVKNGRFEFTMPKEFFQYYGDYNTSYFTFTKFDSDGDIEQHIKSFRVPYKVLPSVNSKNRKNILRGS